MTNDEPAPVPIHYSASVGLWSNKLHFELTYHQSPASFRHKEHEKSRDQIMHQIGLVNLSNIRKDLKRVGRRRHKS